MKYKIETYYGLQTGVTKYHVVNQKGQDVICIYVAIGQKASTVAQIVSTLEKNNAMSYSQSCPN